MAASAETASVIVGSTDLKVPTDELTWFARFTPTIVRSGAAKPTVPVAGCVAAGTLQLGNRFGGRSGRGCTTRDHQRYGRGG